MDQHSAFTELRKYSCFYITRGGNCLNRIHSLLVALCLLPVRGQGRGNLQVLCNPGSAHDRAGSEEQEGVPSLWQACGIAPGASLLVFLPSAPLLLARSWGECRCLHGQEVCLPAPAPGLEEEWLVLRPQEEEGRHGPASSKPTVLGYQGWPLRPAHLPPCLGFNENCPCAAAHS